MITDRTNWDGRPQINFFDVYNPRLEKPTKTGVSRHHGDRIKGPPYAPQYDSVVMYGGFM